MSEQATLPSVSCIIAVFNGETYLHEAIDSLLAQTYPRQVEIVVVNDGSTDATADVIRRYGDRLRVLNQANAGVSIARNRGVAISTGQLVCFLDADDRLEPRKIATQAAALSADPELEFCSSHSSYFWTPEMPQEARERDFRHAETYWRNPVKNHISTWLLRRELWDRVGSFTPGMSYAEDTDWISRARDLSMRSLVLPDVLTYLRLHLKNVTRARSAGQYSQLADMFKAHLVRMRTGSPR